ncbi:MAG: site-2 protease family protein [Vulcanimicrobiaceae bacterium]
MPIGSLFGIRITVNASWLFIFALVAWSFASATGPLAMPELTTPERVLAGIAGSSLFFVSVLAHELAHSLVARRRGIPVRGITLFIFGGVSAIEGEPDSAPAEAWIAGVGPLTSLLIGAAAIGVALLAGHASVAGKLALYLGIANVGLAIFNILPAYPLDGGRVLHALVWRFTKDKTLATRVTVGTGRVLACGLIALGIAQTFATGFGGGLWTTFMGWYLLQAGNLEQSRTTIAHALDGHVARELAAPPEYRIVANATAADALTYLNERKIRAAPVLIGDGFVGVVSLDDLAHVPATERERAFVTSVMQRAETVATVRSDASAAEAVREMAGGERLATALVDETGDFGGLLTRESVMHWLVLAERT